MEFLDVVGDHGTAKKRHTGTGVAKKRPVAAGMPGKPVGQDLKTPVDAQEDLNAMARECVKSGSSPHEFSKGRECTHSRIYIAFSGFVFANGCGRRCVTLCVAKALGRLHWHCDGDAAGASCIVCCRFGAPFPRPVFTDQGVLHARK